MVCALAPVFLRCIGLHIGSWQKRSYHRCIDKAVFEVGISIKQLFVQEFSILHISEKGDVDFVLGRHVLELDGFEGHDGQVSSAAGGKKGVDAAGEHVCGSIRERQRYRGMRVLKTKSGVK